MGNEAAAARAETAASEKEDATAPVLGYVPSRSGAAAIRCLGYAQTCLKADYALVMDDCSMEPLFYRNEYVFVKNEQSPSDGDIVIASRGQSLLCRLYRKTENRIRLLPLNKNVREETRMTDRQTSSEAAERGPGTAAAAEIVGKVLLNQKQQDIVTLFFEEKI